MASYKSQLPKSAMNLMLEAGIKRLRAMTLREKIQLQVRAKLLTEQEADEVQQRLSPEKLDAKPQLKRKRMALKLDSPSCSSSTSPATASPSASKKSPE